MKKLLLIAFIGAATMSFAQTSPINFEPDGNGADFSWATFEAPDGFENPTFTVEANPVTDGINTSATAAKIDIAYPTEDSWGKAGCETDIQGTNMGIFNFTEENSAVRVMIFQEGFAAPVALKFVNNTFGAEFETIVQNDVANEWVEIEFDMSGLISSGVAPFAQLVFFPSYAPRATGHVVWFDNVEFGAGDPPAPDPMVSAPDPTIDEANVLSVYSDTYQVNTVDEFNLNAFGVVASELDLESDGNQTAKLENLNFYGAQWIAADLNDYLYVHFDYWATSSTAFNFYLIDLTSMIGGGTPEEPRYSIGPGGDEELVQGQWVSVFIELQHFLDYETGAFQYDMDDIFQYKFDGLGTLFFDNVYFTTEDPLSVGDYEAIGFNAYPNPSKDFWTITSDGSSIQSVVIMNILGENIWSSNFNSSSVRIEADQLKTGIYLAQIKTSEGTSTVKLVRD